MTSREENKLSMFLKVQDFCELNLSVLTTIPQFTVFYTIFKGYIKLIIDLGKAQIPDLRGFRTNKQSLREILTTKALDIAGRIVAYASVNNLFPLLEKVNLTKSELDKSADTILVQRCKDLQDTATAELANLADYGVTEVMITDMQKANDDYLNYIPKPWRGIEMRKGVTSEMKETFVLADGVLRNKMDKLAGMIKFTNPNLFRDYMNSRMIVDSGKRKSGGKIYVTGTAIDFETGLPLAGASVEVVGTVLIVKTGTDGKYRIELDAAGVISVKCSMTGYRDMIEEDVVVEEGEETVVDFEMEKVEG